MMIPSSSFCFSPSASSSLSSSSLTSSLPLLLSPITHSQSRSHPSSPSIHNKSFPSLSLSLSSSFLSPSFSSPSSFSSSSFRSFSSISKFSLSSPSSRVSPSILPLSITPSPNFSLSPLFPSSYSSSSSSSPFSSSSSSSRSFSSYSNFLPPRAPWFTVFGIAIVPQQISYVVERLGKFHRILQPGLHFLIPFVDNVAYIHSLKEQAIPVTAQQAITADNVTIIIDGVLYIKIIDPEKASYGVNDIFYAMTQLAQTTMRSELGKITLDKTFAERESLNHSIVRGLGAASEPWGVQCLRYEIKDISPPQSIKAAMEMQAEAERKKRATILDSEGAQQAEINVADGQRQSTVLSAQGEAAAILARAEAQSKGIIILANAIQQVGGKDAVALRIAEQYIDAFANIAKTNNTLIIPSSVGDPASMVAQAMTIFNSVTKTMPSGGKSGGDSGNGSGNGNSGEGNAAGVFDPKSGRMS